MRTTQNAADAAHRIAEAHGFRLVSSGRGWMLSRLAEAEVLDWATPMSAVEALGTMLDIVVLEKHSTYADCWMTCMYLPRVDTSGGWTFPDDDTWAGSSVKRMLRDAERAGHLKRREYGI